MSRTHPANTRRKSRMAYQLGDPLPMAEVTAGRIHPKGRGKSTLQDLIGQQGGVNPPEGTYGHVYQWTDKQGRNHQSYSAKVYARGIKFRDNVQTGVNTGFFEGPPAPLPPIIR